MECDKCKATLEKDAVFCGKCGKKKEENLSFHFEESIKNCEKCWFVLGFHRGICLGKKDEEGIQEIEKFLDKHEMLAEYKDVTAFWGEKLNSDMKFENDN